MGNYLPTAQSVSADPAQLCRTYVLDYNPNVVFQRLLNADSSFLKSVYVKCNGGALVIKIYKKADAQENLEPYQISVQRLYNAISLGRCPNLIPYQDWKWSSRHGIAFLVRQHFAHNLHDRMSTRPFFSIIEKRWIAYQLLRALEQLHSVGACHGDIKSENIAVTSWNWVFLTDFACHKPTYIPENNPGAYFSYYFRRRGYPAPERFQKSAPSSDATFLLNLEDSTLSPEEADRQAELLGNEGIRRDGALHYTMDIFSAGCVIGHLFLGEIVVFDLPALLKYKTGDDAMLSELRNIEDQRVQELVRHMLQREPRKRLAAKEYLEMFSGEGKLFPEYFGFLHQFMASLLSSGARSPDSRIHLICKYYDKILAELAGVKDPEGAEFFLSRIRMHDDSEQNIIDTDCPEPRPRVVSGGMGESGLVDKVSSLLLSAMKLGEDLEEIANAAPGTHLSEKTRPKLLQISEDAWKRVNGDGATSRASDMLRSDSSTKRFLPPMKDSGLVLVLSIVTSSLRHVRLPHSKLTGVALLVRLAVFVDDDIRLQRLIPYTVSILGDRSAQVRAVAIRSLTILLSMVKSLPTSDINIFPQYILPALTRFPSDPEEMVRIAFADCLPKLAETSRRYLDIGYAMRGGTVTEENVQASKAKGKRGKEPGSAGYDKDLTKLHEMISRFVVRVAAPDQKSSSALVKRALLRDITRLCIFFGRERTLDVVLPQLTTFLNDRDWELRAAFFEHIAGVCAFVGRTALEMYILPMIEQALIDVEEIVIARALQCLSTLCELGLFQRYALIEKAQTTAPLLLHPGWWVRDGAILLMGCIAKTLGPVDVYAFLLPILRPYLRTPLLAKQISDKSLRDALRKPISRESYDKALVGGIVEATSTPPLESKSSLASSGNVPALTSDGFVAVTIQGQTAELPEGSSSRAGSTRSISSASSADAGQRKALSDKTSSRELGAKQQSTTTNEEETEKLRIISKYIEAASRQMRSKLYIARSEQSAKLRGQQNLSANLDYSKKLSSALIHTLKVPDQRFAPLFVMSQLSALSKRQRSTMGTPLSSYDTYLGKDTLTTSVEFNLNFDEMLRTYGIVAGNDTLMAPRILGTGQSFDTVSSTDGRSTVGSRTPRDTERGTMMSRKDDRLGSGDMAGSKGLLKKSLSIKLDVTDPALVDAQAVLSRVRALNIPPLPPNMGVLTNEEDTVYSVYSNSTSGANSTQTNLGAGAIGVDSHRDWKPKEGVLLAEIKEHSGPINKLAVSQDNYFFASASSDGSIKLWSLRGFADSITHKSSLTKDDQGGRILDIAVCDNTHSMATASDNGSLIVSRIDYIQEKGRSSLSSHSSVVKEIFPEEGAVLHVQYYNTSTEAILVYVTQFGRIHGFDLRANRRAWVLEMSPDLGYISTICIGADYSWLVVGTSRGYIAVYDIRFQLMVKLWRHSCRGVVHKISLCLDPQPLLNESRSASASDSKNPKVYVAAGTNEVAIFDLVKGSCRGVFRTLRPHVTEADAMAVPYLEPIVFDSVTGGCLSTIRPTESYDEALKELHTPESHEPSVRAFISPSLTLRGASPGLITAGSDQQIRYWDLRNAHRSFVLSGVAPGQQRPYFDCQQPPTDWWKHVADWSQPQWKAQLPALRGNTPPIYMCQDTTFSSLTTFQTPDSYSSPALERRGPVPPSPVHLDCILDLKLAEGSTPLVLSAGRDGVVKAWR